MRALLCPIGSRGFVHPMLAVGQELRRRGQEPVFATSDEFAEVITASGFERIPRGPRDGPSFRLAIWGHPIAVAISVRHVQHAIERFRPDVILASPLAVGAMIAGEIADLPVAVLGLATYLWPPSLPGRSLLSWDPQAAWRHRSMLEIYNGARALFGLQPRPDSPAASPLLGSVYLLQSVPQLEPLATNLPAEVRLIGSCLYEPEAPDSGLLEWLAAGRGQPLVYVQHGSVFRERGDFWPALAAAASGVRLAASLGRRRGSDTAMDAHLLARDHVPQQAVLREAQAVVASGNTTAVLGALTHGLPLLLMPSGGEQPALSARCVAAEAAVALKPGTPAGQIRPQLERVLGDPSLRSGARRLQAHFAALQGPALAADTLAELAERGGSGVGVA